MNNYIVQLKQILAQGALSQSTLAQKLGVTFAAFNRWINGHAKPRPSKISAIEKLYREVVGHPHDTVEVLKRACASADPLRDKRIGKFIARESALQEELLLEHTYNSTSIEGTTFTKKETEAVIFDHQVIRDKSMTEHLEVTNHASVLRNIFSEKCPAGISEELIRSIHRDLMQGIRADGGEYSKHERAIRGVTMTLTHPEDIPEEMGLLVKEWLKRSRKSLRDIAHFHSSFELIHPFDDGNGRVGRLLMTIQCLGLGYPPVVIENSRKAEYYDVLEFAQRKSETPFIVFLADEMRRTHRVLLKYGF